MNMRLFLLIAAAAFLPACGGTSRSSSLANGDFAVVSTSVQLGDIWQIDRPVEVTFNQPVDLLSLALGGFSVLDDTGVPALGSIAHTHDGNGVIQTSVVRFWPRCANDGSGAGAGLRPGGVHYHLVVRGADAGGSVVRSREGEPLASSVEVEFVTPTSLDPQALFYDHRPGPPRVMLRGRSGLPLDAHYATHLELGDSPVDRAWLRQSLFGYGELDAAARALLPNGLPLNHACRPDHRVAFVVQFDQPLATDAANLARIGLQYLHGTWRDVVHDVEVLADCASLEAGAGTAVRLTPRGMLPRGTTLRLTIAPGLADRTGESSLLGYTTEAQVETTFLTEEVGAGVDALIEEFLVGGGGPDSNEDVLSDLNGPRAVWGLGGLRPDPIDGDVTRARSKWLRVGLGHLNGGGPALRPRFTFEGTDAQGDVIAVDGVIPPLGPSIGPLGPTSIEPYRFSVPTASLFEPTGLAMANPGVLRRSRARFAPSVLPIGSEGRGPTIVDTRQSAGVARVTLAQGCALPGFGSLGDCVPLNLTLAYPTPAGVSIEVIPQYLECYTGFQRDRVPSDSKITILFDATRANAAGAPDPNAAYSMTSGWTPDVSTFDGGEWDFVRFDVTFDLDASRDGASPFEPVPTLSLMKIVLDHRP